VIACVFIPDLVSCVAKPQPPSENIFLVTPSDYVQAASRGAVLRSVRVGMKAAQARALCAGANVQLFDDTPFQEMDEAIEAELSAFTTQIEGIWGFGYVGKKKRPDQSILPASAAIFYLDLGKLRPSEAVDLARQMQRVLRDALALSSTVGLSRGKFPALVAARVTQPAHPKLVAPGDEGAFLAPFTLDILPLNRETNRRLDKFGIRTLGAFAQLPAAAVLTQFGKEGRALHQWAQGRDTRLVVSRPRKPSERLRQSFDGAVENRLALEAVLQQFGCDFEQRLATNGLTTSKLELALHLENGQVLKSHRVLREPAHNGRLIGRYLVRLLSQLTLPCGVDSVEAIAHDLTLPVMQQLDLFGQVTPTRRLTDLLDTLSERFGTEHVYSVTDLDPDHWLPEYRYALEPVEAA
jgi:nucleotidyltransferase/DNA polymerase involved in DNA repair